MRALGSDLGTASIISSSVPYHRLTIKNYYEFIKKKLIESSKHGESGLNELIGSFLGDKSGVENVIGSDLIEDPVGFASLVLWLSLTMRVELVGVDVVRDPENGEALFVALYLAKCGWEEWGNIAKIVKEQLKREGFEELAGKVAIVCVQALQG